MRHRCFKASHCSGPVRRLHPCPGPRLSVSDIKTRVVATNVSSAKGTSQWGGSNGATAHADTQELFVADLDMTVDTMDESYADRPATTMRVPVPTDVHFKRSSDANADGTALVRTNKALQAELASVRDELVESQQERQHLQIQLAEKERTLQATKADLIETRLELQRTESRLDEVNERLKVATNERGEYRQYLLEAQQELQQTRSELLEWSEGLEELSTVMEGLDEDLTEIFGEGEYSTAVTEAIEATRNLRVPSSNQEALDVLSEERSQSFAAALEDLHKLSAEVLRQAEEDRRLFGM